MIRFGYNAELKDAPALAELGYDYIETGLSGLAALDEEEFSRQKQALLATPLRAEVLNILLPPQLKVVGDTYSRKAAEDYLDGALPRAKQLGAQLVVFGSGGAKRIPEGFSHSRAMEQLRDFVDLLAKKAQEYDLLFPIEALRHEECNCINSLAEARELMESAHSPRIRMLADLFHMAAVGETPADMQALGDTLIHVHIARPQSRTSPAPGDGYDYAPFFAALAEMGYGARISFEGKVESLSEEAAVCLETLKQLCAQAGL